MYITHQLSKCFVPGNTYSILVKLNYIDYEDNILHCMLDKQKGIVYTNKEDLKVIIDNWYSDLEDMFNFYMDKYEAIDVESIQFMYVVNNSFPSLRLKNINKESFDKEIVSIKDTKN